jgi:hypothetical protein
MMMMLVQLILAIVKKVAYTRLFSATLVLTVYLTVVILPLDVKLNMFTVTIMIYVLLTHVMMQ